MRGCLIELAIVAALMWWLGWRVPQLADRAPGPSPVLTRAPDAAMPDPLMPDTLSSDTFASPTDAPER